MTFLENVQWDRFGQALRDLWAAPGSNLGASLLFVAAVGILLLIFVVIGIVTIYSMTVDDDDDDDDEDEDYDDEERDQPRGDSSATTGAAIEDEQPEGPERFPRWARGLVWLAFFAIALVAFDFIVGDSDVCISCHVEGPHAREDTDPHQAVTCVRCHEDRRGAAMLSSSAGRGLHVFSAAVNPAWSGGYGAVTARACDRCHKKQTRSTITIAEQEIRISHVEPLEGGAICTDCHLLNDDGEIAERNRGMTPCLRCHDGKRAENECGHCHLGDTSAAIRDDEKEMVFSATILVPDHRCGGCHTDQSKCDKCHGLRMPHSLVFKERKHAKSAAFRKKESCIKVCHTLNDCNGCHGFHPGQTVSGHAPNWTYKHGAGRSMQSACACHGPDDAPETPFCPLCHD